MLSSKLDITKKIHSKLTLSSLTPAQIEEYTELLKEFSVSYLTSNEIANVSLDATNHLLDKNINTSDLNLLTPVTLQNLGETIGNILSYLYHSDCTGASEITNDLYANSVNAIDTLERVLVSENTSDHSTIDTSSFTIFSKRFKLEDLNRTTITAAFPAFEINDIEDQDPNEEVDVHMVTWKEEITKCRNETDPQQTPSVTLEVRKKGTDTLHPLTRKSSVSLYYIRTDPKYTSCQQRCQPQNSSQSQYYKCFCPKLSDLSIENQLLSVFVNSNLGKLGNFSGLNSFAFYRYYACWVLIALLLIFIVANCIFLAKKYNSKNTVAEVSCIRNRSLSVRAIAVPFISTSK